MLTLTLVFAVSVIAGFIDAIAGGGGLIMVPTLLFAGLPPVAAVATNKTYNVVSSLTSLIRFWKSGAVSFRHFAWMIAPGLLGSLLGSALIGILPQEQAEPVISVLLVAVAVMVLFKKDPEQSPTPFRRVKLSFIALSVSGFFIGVHDGFFGPGAGVFLIFALTQLGGCSYLTATGTSKLINLMTSLVALGAFILQGSIDLNAALIGGAGIVIGSYLGSGYAGKQGGILIRPALLCMALAIVAKLTLG